MEVRTLKVIFGKDGRGSTNTKITLPIGWLKDMGISPDERDVEYILDKDKKEIIIRKK